MAISSGNKILASDVTAHINDKNNPHGITAESIGAMVGSNNLVAGTDFNTVTTSGIYRFNNNNTNGPGVDWGQLLVMHGGGDTITQIASDFSSGSLYTRSGNPSDVGGAGSWTAWQKLATEEYVNNVIEANTLKAEIIPTASYGMARQGGDSGEVLIMNSSFPVAVASITFSSNVNYGSESYNSPTVTSATYASGKTIDFIPGTYNLGQTRVRSYGSGYCYLNLQLIVKTDGVYYRVYDPGSSSWSGRSSAIWQTFGGKVYNKIPA